MAEQPKPSRSLLTALRWPFGIAYTSWGYLWRTTPVHRRELEGSAEEDSPPPLPGHLADDEVQRPDDGFGPLLRRRYTGRFRGSRLSAAELIDCLAADPNRAAPGAFTKFEKVEGGERMQVGDRYVVRMPGPWDGPVSVIEVTPTSFRFATLRGHLEAGQIEWRAEDDGELVFQVESWARAGDRLSHVLHNQLRMAKEVQLHMWTSVVEEIADLTGGRLTGGLDIDTRRVEAERVPTG